MSIQKLVSYCCNNFSASCPFYFSVIVLYSVDSPVRLFASPCLRELFHIIFFKIGQPQPLFSLFLSFRTKKLTQPAGFELESSEQKARMLITVDHQDRPIVSHYFLCSYALHQHTEKLFVIWLTGYHKKRPAHIINLCILCKSNKPRSAQNATSLQAQPGQATNQELVVTNFSYGAFL